MAVADGSLVELESTSPTGRVWRHATVAANSGLRFADVDQVDVKIRDLGVSIKTMPPWAELARHWHVLKPDSSQLSASTTLVRSVSANFQPGTVTAILGGSGAGKTTLLDAIAERIVGPRFTRSGVASFSGGASILDVRHAYVMQQDVLLPTLTVRETLQYAAQLRLPPATSAHELQRVVENIIHELALQDCAETHIGTSRSRGCSGGEKRRVSIGVQLLANPSILFLDEPTTGLDAASALQLMSTLKSLARGGRVIVTTIHQPRSEIWDLFDNLIILTKGTPVYSGPISVCLSWFEAQGFRPPVFTNPADFIVDITSFDYRSAKLEQESSARVQGIRAAWLLESAGRFPPLSALPCAGYKTSARTSGRGAHAGLLRQIRVLAGRTIKVTYRDPLGMMAAIIEATLMGLAAGYMFYDLRRDEAGIKSRQGCLYVAACLQGYVVLIFETYRMTLDIPTFDRESLEGCVSPLAFIISRRLARVATEDIPVPLIFSTLIYFIAGFDHEVGKFFIFVAISILAHYASITCATLCVVLQRHFAGASLIANLAYILQASASGLTIQINTMPVYVRWIRWITYTFYIFTAYVGNEFQGSFYACPHPGGPSNPACVQYTGEFIIGSLGFPHNWVSRPMGYLAAFSFCFSTFSVIGLRYMKTGIRASLSRDMCSDLPDAEVESGTHRAAGTRAITVGLERLALKVETSSILGKSKTAKPIFGPLDARFSAGILNVIIGPSGSGKTSLLNAISSRLRNTMRTRYGLVGKMTFNGTVPSSQVVQAICCYVHQDDDALLPTLTVRETLRYAAALRLPAFMTLGEKNRRAEDVLLKLGLKDCANNLIGDELTKGISGGEKRRVSIAVQILTEPRVLLIDEPTSGLDAFTANSIVQVLQGLANEGRTIIIAMHQARSDIFNQFGSVLVLARGGFPAYFGAAEDMVSYFGRHGYQCPAHTNPADFALDIISSRPKDGDATSSHERVKGLIALWAAASGDAGVCDGETLRESNDSTFRNGATIGFNKNESTAKVLPDGLEMVRIGAIHPRPLNEGRLDLPAELGAFMRTEASFRTSVPILLRRSIINTWRQPRLVIARVMQPVGTALLFALFFSPLGNDVFSAQTRMGFFQQLGGFYIIGMLTNVAVYPSERDVFYREHEDTVYGADAFLATYTVIELPFEIVSSILFGIIVTFAVGLPHTAVAYFVAVLVSFTCLSCGESLGIIFNALVSHTGFAINLMGVFLALANSMAGVLSIDMPALFRYFNYLSPIRYTTRALAYSSLHDLKFICTEGQLLQDGTCPITRGDQVLSIYKFNDPTSVNLVGMAGCIFVYRVLAWVTVKIRMGNRGTRKLNFKG